MEADLIERVLNAGNFTALNQAWDKCQLEDILSYQIGERLKFGSDKGLLPLDVNRFENLLFSNLYSKEDKTNYMKDALKDFLKYGLTPKREALKHRLDWYNRLIFAGSAIGAAAMAAGAFAVPYPYLPFLVVSGFGALTAEYIYLRHRKKALKFEVEADNRISLRNIALLKSAKDFDCEQFFAKKKENLKQIISQYWNDYHSKNKVHPHGC